MTSQSEPSFSVVIPLYNKEAYIREAIATVQAQTHRAFEIVLVDDGSTDGSVAAVEPLLSPTVRLLRQRNAGPGAARNRGISEARHEWVALLDADDLWLPDHLATMAALVRQFPAADLVTSDFRRVATSAASGQDFAPSSEGYELNYFKERAQREVVWTSAVAIRRSAFLATEGFGNYWPGQDSAFWAQFALDHRYAATRRVTALYRVDTGGITNTHNARKKRAEIPANPVVAILDRALDDARYAASHADIAHLRDVTYLRTARQALYRGDVDAAREAMAHIPALPGRLAASYRLLTRLPAPVLAATLRGHRLVKALTGRERRRP